MGDFFLRNQHIEDTWGENTTRKALSRVLTLHDEAAFFVAVSCCECRRKFQVKIACSWIETNQGLVGINHMRYFWMMGMSRTDFPKHKSIFWMEECTWRFGISGWASISKRTMQLQMIQILLSVPVCETAESCWWFGPENRKATGCQGRRSRDNISPILHSRSNQITLGLPLVWLFVRLCRKACLWSNGILRYYSRRYPSCPVWNWWLSFQPFSSCQTFNCNGASMMLFHAFRTSNFWLKSLQLGKLRIRQPTL